MNYRLALPAPRAAALALALSIPLALATAAPAIRGVPNLRTINDRVYRGGQPSDEGFRNLAAAGVKTIVDLREHDERSKQEKRLVEALGMKYVNIPMKGMHTPDDKQVAHALKILNDDKAAPVFVHCKRGADRTGLVLACYRIEHDNWSNAEALQEARDYGMYWYQFPLQKYVLGYRPHSDGLTDRAADVTDAGRELGENAVEKLKDLSRSVTEIFK
ncbi:MAG TPA: tyrosine-protein phosphatase [Bryobacteraceae bacterium]|jgi:protein tyrosine phosphatase (PTP) superfamily phosphohydrolase (DUF442 family)